MNKKTREIFEDHEFNESSWSGKMIALAALIMANDDLIKTHIGMMILALVDEDIDQFFEHLEEYERLSK